MDTHLEILRAAAGALRGQLGLLALLMAGAAWLVWVEHRLAASTLDDRRRAALHALVVAAAAATGLTFAWQIAWLGDDAYISFRYARNLAQGHGLVYNPGEWVEGYTNFLWTLALGALASAGLSIEHAALFGDLAAFAATLVVVAATVRRASPTPGLLPFAAIALAGTRPFTTFATSGLETLPTALLIATGLWASTLRRHGALLCGLFFGLAVLSRLDQALLLGCMGLALAGEDLLHRRDRPLARRLDVGRLVRFALPVGALAVPTLAWRWWTYGDILPNTYYAKSAGEPYWAQGLVYLTHFLATTGAVVWIPVAAIALLGPARDRDETRLRLLAVLSVGVVGTYVTRVGGDFMEHRFYVTLLPIVAVALATSVRWRLTELEGWPARALLAGAVAALVAAVTPIRVLAAGEHRWHLADEATFYPVTRAFPITIPSPYAHRGHALRRVLTDRGLRPRLAGDSIGIVGFLSDLPVVDLLGLLNRNIARKPVVRRSRPGHEKFASVDELIVEGAVISVENLRAPSHDEATRAVVDGFTFHFLRWDRDTFAALAAVPGAVLPDPAGDVIRTLPTVDRRQQVGARGLYTSFLADHPARDDLLARIDGMLASVADFEPWQPAVAAAPPFRVLDARVAPGASGEGLLATLPDGNVRTGSFVLAMGPIAAPELRFVLGGQGAVWVEVEAGGTPVATLRPRGLVLQPVAVDLSDHLGKPALLRIVDDDPAEGAGLGLDAVHWAGGPGDVRARLRDGPADPVALLRVAQAVLPPDDPAVLSLAERVVGWSFEEGLPPGTVLAGDAFGTGPARGGLAGQMPVSGQHGPHLLNSFHGGDGARGAVTLPPIDLSGHPIHVRVGGGGDCERTFVGLQVDGIVVDRVCGRDDEVLRPATLAAAGHAGARGQVVVVDDGAGAWGHILADDIVYAAPVDAPDPKEP